MHKRLLAYLWVNGQASVLPQATRPAKGQVSVEKNYGKVRLGVRITKLP